MSKIIIAFSNENFGDYFQSLINGLFEEEIILVRDGHEALNHFSLNKNSTSLTIVDFGTPGSDELICSILSQEKSTPLLIVSAEQDLAEAKKKYKSHSLLEYISYYENSDLLWRKIEKMVGLSKRSKEIKKYCKVNLQFFYSSSETFCDVYLKLTDKKFIKVFNRYEQLDPDAIKKFESKKVKYLYVRERDFGTITKKLLEYLRPLEKGNTGALSLTPSLHQIFPIQLQETVSESIQKLGLNQEAVEMTNIALNSTMSLIKSEKEIYDVLKSTIQGQNYTSEHSFLLSYVSCALLKESPYADEENCNALTIAAFFHDIMIEEDCDAKVQNVKEYKFKTMGYSEQEDILAHPQRASDLVQQIEGLPDAVDDIILNHHESYDGSGFPKGIDFKRIPPLSAIFNVAHEIVLTLYEAGINNNSIDALLEDIELKYTKGNYKMAAIAAKTVFCQSNRTLKASA